MFCFSDQKPLTHLLPKGKYFDRIVITIFENKNFLPVSHTKVFSNLAKRGLLLENHYGVAHPSFPNYLALVSGDTYGQSKRRGNGMFTKSINLKDTLHIGDLMDKKGVSWGTFLEGYPSSNVVSQTIFPKCHLKDEYITYIPTGEFGKFSYIQSKYVRKHNPFMSFESVSTNPKRCSQHIKSFKQLDHILRHNSAANLPQFMLVIPNMDHNGHNSPLYHVLDFIDRELMPRFDNKKFGDRTLFLVTFDEDDFAVPYNNRVYTVLWGAGIENGTVDNGQRTDHYSILKTIEDNWDLGDLGKNDKNATPLPIRKYQKPVSAKNITEK